MYYLVTVGFETERVDRQGNPRIEKLKYPVQGQSVEEATEMCARYNSDSVRNFEILGVTKMNIERVIDEKNNPDIYKTNF